MNNSVFCVLFLSGLSLVFGGLSPNAELVDELIREGHFGNVSRSVWEDAMLDVPGLISKYGFPAETHSTVTEDGYVLTFHRIPHGRVNTNVPAGGRPVAFVMHGLMSSSAAFIMLGPEISLAYILVEAGYDVWLGNARGTHYCKQHLYLDPKNDLDFWKFSWEQMGRYDLPAMIDYTLHTTGRSELHYVGHSQGGSAFLVMASMRPEYNKKIISFQGLAPASYMTHNQFKPIAMLAPYTPVIEAAAWKYGFVELLPHFNFLGLAHKQLQRVCTRYFGRYSHICVGFVMNNVEENLGNFSYVPVVIGHHPGGASIRQIAHYGQLILSKTFSQYDYGILYNWIEYNSATPPPFNLSLITAPAYIHYTRSDFLVHYDDVFLMASELGNLIELIEIEDQGFGHESFMFYHKEDVLLDVFDKVLRAMRHAEVLRN